MAKVAVVVLVAFALALAFTGTALAHNQDSASATCTSVSGTFSQFGSADHPIVWHVAVDGGAFRAVATTEHPASFVGTGTATAGIAALTTAFGPAGGSVTFYATWPGGQSATTTVHLPECDAPPTTVPPPTTAPPPSPPGPPAVPAVPVVVHPAPVVFAPTVATAAVPVVAVPATAG